MKKNLKSQKWKNEDRDRWSKKMDHGRLRGTEKQVTSELTK
jgi:hypothetical protein